MYISELCGGEAIKLEVTMNGTRVEFVTTVVAVEDKKQVKALEGIAQKFPYVVVEAITKGGKVLGFPPRGASYKVTSVDKKTKKPFEWQNVLVKQVALANGNKYHMLISDQNVKEINRRERYRLWLGCDGLLQMGISKNAASVIIKDISATGIAFILENKSTLDEKMIPKKSSMVSLSFSDGETNTKFHVTAVVVRVEETENGRLLYGCKLTQESGAIAKFVNDKQRERNRLNRQ